MKDIKEHIENILTSNLVDSYFCTRVWDAWQCGTMTEEDFKEVNESESIADIVDELKTFIESQTNGLKQLAKCQDKTICFNFYHPLYSFIC
ncbi:unnamed protein product [marine sediment metagenome]|uniref:Uncharacterized protein n=1 Tax=marine sediment metagenome TaxID=412755 RepID=X1A7Z4_9ZZZZ